MTASEEPLAFSVKQAARLLGLSTRTVYDMVYTGQLPAKRIVTSRGQGKGGKYIIPKWAIDEWLATPDEPRMERNLRLLWEREAKRKKRATGRR